MGVTEEVGKVGTAAIGAMSGSPLAIALLFVNFGFLGLTAYVLGEVANSAQDRQKTQMALIEKLVTDIRDCRQGQKPTWFGKLSDYPLSTLTNIDVQP